MAKRRSTPRDIGAAGDAVREAVERTLQATVGQAQLTRERAQDAVDEIVRGAEASAARFRDALEDRRPATHEDLKELRSELRAIVRRLEAIEQRLPSKRASAGRKPVARSAKKASGSAKRSTRK